MDGNPDPMQDSIDELRRNKEAVERAIEEENRAREERHPEIKDQEKNK